MVSYSGLSLTTYLHSIVPITLQALAEPIAYNNSLRMLNIASTSFGKTGTQALGSALNNNKTLELIGITAETIFVEYMPSLVTISANVSVLIVAVSDSTGNEMGDSRAANRIKHRRMHKRSRRRSRRTSSDGARPVFTPPSPWTRGNSALVWLDMICCVSKD